jgi:hypothetical protein
MKVQTGWVSPPQSIGGLDHLGTQAPCILVYSQLLPGITNVTDRARYYSFYPWVLWSFDQRYAKDDTALFIEYFRRADCLFTLLSERHSRVTDLVNERHGIAMVGRVQLTAALDRLKAEGELRLSRYTSQDSPNRYFKNHMGGLAQYYAGTLSDLKLLDASSKPWFKYTKELGAPLAGHVDSAIPADHFWKVVENDVVTCDDLDSLSALCPCQLCRSADECESLLDILFDRTGSYEQEGTQRRRSLGLVLHLAHSLPGGCHLREDVFRACTYSGALPGQTPWAVPESLGPTLSCWATYQRNDLLSVTCQTVLGMALRALESQATADRLVYESVEAFAEAFSKSELVAAVGRTMNAMRFDDFMDRVADSMPPLEHWESEEHEIQVADRMQSGWSRDDGTQTLLRQSVTMLALLACRDRRSSSPYGGVVMAPEALGDYPINLATFRTRSDSWRSMHFSEFVSDLVMWCMNTHLQVALRKLRSTGRSTFHLRPSERGLEVVGDIPPPANTTPRFRQAVQVLRDVGALTHHDSTTSGVARLSERGLALMELSFV